jgi:hypothetical protein
MLQKVKSTEPAVTKNDKPTKSVSTETTPATAEEPSVKSYSKFDFVPVIKFSTSKISTRKLSAKCLPDGIQMEAVKLLH